MHNWYKVLGTTSEADDSQLKSSFRNLAKTFHPDVNAGDKRAEERFKEVNRAYEVLRDPNTRAVYDAFLASQSRGARRRLWKSAATMCTTFVVCVAICFSLVPWLIGERFSLALDGAIVRQPDSEPARIMVGTVVAAGDNTRIAHASPLEPDGVAEPLAPQAPLAGAPTSNKRIVHARWITNQLKRANYTAKLTPSAVHTEGELAQGERMLSKGDQFLAQGNIVIAREYFARAAALGLPIAAFRLAETHDPHERWRFQVHGLKHDPTEAKRWYERAIELGASEAEPKLRRLTSR
jgi:hypothetical protein